MGRPSGDYLPLLDESSASAPAAQVQAAVSPRRDAPIAASTIADAAQPSMGQPVQPYSYEPTGAFANLSFAATADASNPAVSGWAMQEGVPMGRLWRGPVLNCTGVSRAASMS